MGFAISLNSCSKDDDNINKQQDPTKQYAGADVLYQLSLSEDFLELFDIYVTYTEKAGQDSTIHIENDWEVQFNYPATEPCPMKYAFGVVAKPKDPTPAVDPDRLYRLSSAYTIDVTVKYTNNTKEGLNISSPGNQLSVPGSKLTDENLSLCITKEHNIVHYATHEVGEL